MQTQLDAPASPTTTLHEYAGVLPSSFIQTPQPPVSMVDTPSSLNQQNATQHATAIPFVYIWER